MKYLLLLMCLIQEPLWAGVIHNQDSAGTTRITINKNAESWIAKDKAQHFIASFYLTGLTKLSLNKITALNNRKSLQSAVGFTLSVALFKEFYDSTNKNNYFSYKDIAADLAGILIAILIFN